MVSWAIDTIREKRYEGSKAEKGGKEDIEENRPPAKYYKPNEVEMKMSRVRCSEGN